MADKQGKYEGPERREIGPLLEKGVSVADVVSIVASCITAIGIGGPLLVWGGKMDARLAAVEARQERGDALQRSMDQQQDKERESLRAEIRSEVREINAKLDRLIERVGGGGARR